MGRWGELLVHRRIGNFFMNECPCAFTSAILFDSSLTLHHEVDNSHLSHHRAQQLNALI